MIFQKYLINYLIIINIISFIICFIDKRKAIKNSWRIPEKKLLFISLIGGCFGFYLSMKIFHHKTKKLLFEILIPIMIIIWIYVIYKIAN